MDDTPLKKIAIQIDTATDNADIDALKTLIEICSKKLETANGANNILLHYFRANSYAGLVKAKYDIEYMWLWNQDEATNELFDLRRAITHPDFETMPLVRKFQIRTNLANRLNSLGRSIEAIEQWDKVILDMPRFAMALGNRAYGLQHYARCLYDVGHHCVVLDESRNSFRRALDDKAVWDSGYDERARSVFTENLNLVERRLENLEFNNEFDQDEFSIGETWEEQNYRRWCLDNRLFINPMNDAITNTVAATDVMHLPSHSYEFDEKPRFPVYFNHLKQEYVSARFRLWNAVQIEGEHFSDYEVLLTENVDAGEFGHHTEEFKSAFRTAYSIFDKIGMFLNDYFKVGLKPRDATFRRVWTETVKGGKTQIRDVFRDRQNWPLRGLYFLSKDIFDSDFSDLAAPDAQELANIRNYAEHRFITLQHYDFRIENDDYRMALTTDLFIEKTLRVIKMARAALIYLSLAMYVEETKKEKDDEGLSITLPSMSILRSWDIELE